MRWTLPFLAVVFLFGSASATQDKEEQEGALLKAIVLGIDHLKPYLLVVATKDPESVKALKKKRPDLAGLLEDVEKTVANLRPRMEKLIDKLGSATLAERTKAKDEILKLGPVARPFLEKLLDDDDAELRARAKELLGQVEGKLVEAARVPGKELLQL